MAQKILKLHPAGDMRSEVEQRVARLIKPLPMNLVYFDSESRIQGISDDALNAFGYELDDVIGVPVTDFLSPDSAEKCRVRHPDFWSEGDMILEVKVRHQSGALHKVLASITFDLDEFGNAEGAMVVADILSMGPPELWREHKTDLPYGLTDREHQVLEAAATGKTSKQIASMLNISHETVHKHIGHTLIKMNAPSRIDACVRGVQEGWLLKLGGRSPQAAEGRRIE